MTLEDKLKALDKLSANINKKSGRTIMGRLSNEEVSSKMVVEFIHTPSIDVNEAIGGGFPVGKITTIAGLPDSGKTCLVLETIGKKMAEDENFTVFWLESEFSLSQDLLDMFKIDSERFTLLEITKEDAGEGALDIVDSVITAGVVDMLIINSLKALVPSEEYTKNFDQVGVGVQARMNSKMVRKFAAPLAENKICMIIITHLTTDIGTFSYDPYVISGGKGIEFASSLILDMRKRGISDSDPVSRDEAIKVNVKVKKNHCVPTKFPYVQADYYAIINEGIEQYFSLLDKAVAQGVLMQGGAFIKDPDEAGDPIILEDGTKLQWQGKKAFREYLVDNPEYLKELQARIMGEVVELDAEEVAKIKAEEEEAAEIAEQAKKEAEAPKKAKKKTKKAASKK